MNTIVILPTYKEAENLKILVPQLLKIDNLSVLVVDDSSPDNTLEIIDILKEEYPDKILFFRRKERGRATAGIFGFKKALKKNPKFIVEMDADLSHRPEDVKIMLGKIYDYDVVIGSRFVTGGHDLREEKSRQFLSQISRKFYQIITGMPIKDIGSGFKCYKAHVIKNLLESEFFSKAGTSICLEINFKIIKQGFKITEVPIKFVDRIHGESKLNWKSFVEPLIIALKLVKTYGRIR
jgi:dolichol-phosphate mannosyltransferase